MTTNINDDDYAEALRERITLAEQRRREREERENSPETAARLSADLMTWIGENAATVTRAHANLAKLKRHMDSGAFLRKVRRDPAAAAEEIAELLLPANSLTPCGCAADDEGVPTLSGAAHALEVERWKKRRAEAENARWHQVRDDAEKRRPELIASDTPFLVTGGQGKTPWKSAAKGVRLHHASCNYPGDETVAYGHALSRDEATAFMNMRADSNRVCGVCIKLTDPADSGQP